jgi:hypothetical protein
MSYEAELAALQAAEAASTRVLLPSDIPVPSKMVERVWCLGSLTNLKLNGWQMVTKENDTCYLRKNADYVNKVANYRIGAGDMLVQYGNFHERKVVMSETGPSLMTMSIGWTRNNGFTTCAEGSLEKECIDTNIAKIYYFAYKHNVTSIIFLCDENNPLSLELGPYASSVNPEVAHYINYLLCGNSVLANASVRRFVPTKAEKEIEARWRQREYEASAIRADDAMNALLAEEQREERQKQLHAGTPSKKAAKKAAKKERMRNREQVATAQMNTLDALHAPVSTTPSTSSDACVVGLANISLSSPPVPVDASASTLADAVEPPESTIGGETTCIICMTNPKTHLAAPCGHHCVCGTCAAELQLCPYCRQPAIMWVVHRLV